MLVGKIRRLSGVLEFWDGGIGRLECDVYEELYSKEFKVGIRWIYVYVVCKIKL